MGFLAKLLAPHVVGTPEQAAASPSPSPPPPSSSSSSPTPTSTATLPPTHYTPPSIDTSSTAHLTPLQRQVKQLSLLLLGAGFVGASAFVTRRAVLRRQLEAVPRFFHSSYLPAGSLDSGERSALAAQALGLATLNVAGFGVLLVGGTGWAFDLCSMAELRARSQAVTRSQAGVRDEEEEREVDNMVMGLMERLGMDVEELKEKDRRAVEAERAPKA
ncbi:hypothetical protein ISF_01275 [Cordyceps fumosorosea ARSEF 2679]|uniref:Altered inheritance of mitochondria protein 11 n=1 Tax=Cordyceps fumosorosea (strain ARSEF 2679) TaxID=1081104 RepID=A0A162JQA8_CORFA|nr:hypothetical protein ISF_01275 [Cordyceps fumosorosea ARSEF 2679]OAA72202.1 hypothetical protein ISF_01275 [Cordyceps fumosorosea ARSEF 2679]